MNPLKAIYDLVISPIWETVWSDFCKYEIEKRFNTKQTQINRVIKHAVEDFFSFYHFTIGWQDENGIIHKSDDLERWAEYIYNLKAPLNMLITPNGVYESMIELSTIHYQTIPKSKLREVAEKLCAYIVQKLMNDPKTADFMLSLLEEQKQRIRDDLSKDTNDNTKTILEKDNEILDGIRQIYQFLVSFTTMTAKEANDYVVSNTMEVFCHRMGVDYDSENRMKRFHKAEQYYKDYYWHLRDMVEYSLDELLTDERFNEWIDIYNSLSSNPLRAFTERERIRTRIECKLASDEILSWGNFEELAKYTIEQFSISWKHVIIDILAPLDMDLAFAKKPENLDAVLVFFKQLSIDCSLLDEHNACVLRDNLKHPHFNKVQIVSGTSGAGKTHFVKLYQQEVLRAYSQRNRVPVPCPIEVHSITSLSDDISRSLHSFLEIDCKSLEEYCTLLKVLNIDIAFVIENVNALKDFNWPIVANVIKEHVKYDCFKFIVTVNEYEYYQIEQSPDFLNQYCIENPKDKDFEYSILNNCLSIDKVNKQQDVIGHILRDKYDINTDFQAGLTTPLEAIYYGDCSCDETIASPPESYLGYIEKITRWKESQLGRISLEYILNEIIDQKSNLIHTDLDVSPFRNVQLLTPITEVSIFSSSPRYRLSIYPYWATKIIG